MRNKGKKAEIYFEICRKKLFFIFKTKSNLLMVHINLYIKSQNRQKMCPKGGWDEVMGRGGG